MTALDLGAATRTLTPPSTAFASIMFGDAELLATSPPHDVTAVGPYDAIPLTDNSCQAEAEGEPSVGDHVLFVAFSNLASMIGVTDAGGGFASPTGVIVWAYGEGTVDAQQYGEDESIAAGAITLNGALSVIAVNVTSVGITVATFTDGVVGTGSPQTSPNGNVANFGGQGAENVGLLGAWEFEDTTVDEETMLDTLAAIAALFSEVPEPVVPVAVHGIGGWGIDAAAAIATVDGDDEDVEVPDPDESAGEQEPPTWPDADFTGGDIAPIRHISETMPAPTIVDGHVDMDSWQPTAETNAPWAYRRLIIEGVDVTTFLDLEVGSFAYTRSTPFGPRSARIDLPQITPWVTIPSWAKPGANVSIQYLEIDTEEVLSAWEGVVTGTSVSDDTGQWGLDCTGVMFASDYQLRDPSPMTAPQDIGGLIPKLVNGAISRRTATMAKVATGIKRAVSGGWDPLLTGFIQQLLATAISDGKQWTVQCAERTPVLTLKDTTTVDVDIRFGQRGIVVDLTRDVTEATNAIKGEWVTPSGGRCANWKYPNWKPDDTPLFPLDPSAAFYIGLRNSGTTSGRGVSDAQDKLDRPVTGTWNRGDVKALRRMQERAGITVDGSLGPQSWAAMFDTGANTGSLNGAFIAPLAVSTKVQPYKYGPDGDKLGPNPNYDPSILRVEDKIDFGEGYTKSEVTTIAREVLARNVSAGWTGTITFRIDPPQKSRFRIVEGDNIKLRGMHGQDLMLNVAQVDAANETVRVTVDTKARDYPTVEALLSADRNATDPAKAAVKRLVYGKVGSDRPLYDAESPAGRMPRHAINGGLWDVRRIPLGAFGTVALTAFYTDNPTKFTLAVFGKKVTANQLLSWVGNPLTTDENPWEDDDLDSRGLLMAWGWKKQPLGYGRATFSNPDGETGKTLTGRFVDDASWEYASAASPWVWVAMMTANDCYAWGRLYGRSGAW